MGDSVSSLIDKILLANDLDYNLLSISQLYAKSFKMIFEPSYYII